MFPGMHAQAPTKTNIPQASSQNDTNLYETPQMTSINFLLIDFLANFDTI